MHHEFLKQFMEREAFPAPAQAALQAVAREHEAALDAILTAFSREYDHAATAPLVEELAEQTGCSAYSLWMVVLILAAEQARAAFPTEALYWEIFQDLRYKLMECHRQYGVWGTFVSSWYPRFFKGDIVQLGRLQFEVRRHVLSEPVTLFGITMQPEDPLIFIHIPSSGEPFDTAGRMASYRRAYEHFCGGKGLLVCVCDSWLLYPGYEAVFKGNIADFRRDFHLWQTRESERFGDCWRVFGAACDRAPEELPEDTSLQRAFKAYIRSGGSFGSGTGVLVFDGERVLSRT